MSKALSLNLIMFQNLKHKSSHESNWQNMDNAWNFHISPGARTGNTKGNEADRMVHCRICGFLCDTQRDSKSKEGSWAGLGKKYSGPFNANPSIGDRRVPAAGVVATTVDQYYLITQAGGCANCGCFTYNF